MEGLLKGSPDPSAASDAHVCTDCSRPKKLGQTSKNTLWWVLIVTAVWVFVCNCCCQESFLRDLNLCALMPYLPMCVILMRSLGWTSTPSLNHFPVTFSSDTSHLNTACSVDFTVRSAMLCSTCSSLSETKTPTETHVAQNAFSQQTKQPILTRSRW